MPVAQGILVFTVPGVGGEQYKFLGCLFGPTNAPGHCQKEFSKTLEPMLNKLANVLLDNAVIYSKMWVDHLRDLKQALGLFCVQKWKLKRKKCKFGQQSVELLGHVVSKDGICQDSKKRRR